MTFGSTVEKDLGNTETLRGRPLICAYRRLGTVWGRRVEGRVTPMGNQRAMAPMSMVQHETIG